jgi:hypothetical protein
MSDTDWRRFLTSTTGQPISWGAWKWPCPAGSRQTAPADLGHPMRYAVLDGGKRLRPLLVLAAAEVRP